MAAVARHAPIIGVQVNPETIVSPVWRRDKWEKSAPGIRVQDGHFLGNQVGAQGQDVPVYSSHEVFNVTAPNGELVPVYKCIKIYESEDGWSGDTRRRLVSDGCDEVATSDNPASDDPKNTTAYRVAKVFVRVIVDDPVRGRTEETRYAGAFDYSRYGFQKVGKIWIDPRNQKDVEAARNREYYEKNGSCILL